MLYVQIENSEVIELTDIKEEGFQEIDANSLDEAINKIKEATWKIDGDLVQRLEEIFSDNQPEENFLEAFDIKVSTENRSFNELADMFSEGDIKIPDVQRKFVWDTNKCSKIIESILLGLPIPPLFFMDIGNNSYEVIDGLQRLTAISNYILGNQWGAITNDTQRNNSARLSQIVDKSISGKTFKELTDVQQKKLKRSTVTVIDFRQINPQNEKAKYLIFERINTGSELLNPMQIRKALAYGTFMSEIYEAANSSTALKSIYGRHYLNKDRHVELFLGVYSTYKILEGEYNLTSQYQKYILNDFCEENKNETLEFEFIEKFNENMKMLSDKFDKKDIFRKIDDSDEFQGNRNTNIAETLLATMIQSGVNNLANIVDNYKKEIRLHSEKFTQNKITKELLKERRDICKRILGI